MLQQHCVLQNVFAVTGGGLNLTPDGLSRAHDNRSWIIQPTLIDGKNFGDIYSGNYHCRLYVGNDFAMVDHLRDLRNAKVKELMQALSAAADPNEENVLTDGPLTMPKRELFDNLPAIITINVKTMSSMVAEVNVLPDWRLKGVLKLEITKTNLDLLLEKPPAGTAPWTPTIEQPDVYWRPRTNSVYCSFWDSRVSKRRQRAVIVDVSSEMGEEDKLEAVNRAASEVQAFYESHHNQSGNMPAKRCRETDDDDSQSDAVRRASTTGDEETE